jgi:ABC-type lipoprotein export system ATPase subunit
VTAESLAVAVPGRLLFDGLRFDWASPGLVAVVGPSGVGKSTLLSAIMGWTKPKAGRLVTDPGDAARWFVPQNVPLLDSRTARANLEVAMLARWRGHRGGQGQAAGGVDDVLGAFGLTRRAAVVAKHLSGGERQRLALAGAALRRPDLLLADEVTAGLDPTSVELVTAALRQVADGGALVIVATHDHRVWSGADMVLDLAAVAS